MEPKSPTPQFNSEHIMPGASMSEHVPLSSRMPERFGESGMFERGERQTENYAANTSPVPVMPPPVSPVVSPVVDAATAMPTPATPNPLTASDDDLIEKEWVDRAKKIISATKEDPYKREVEITKLQIDYLKKRYGREMGEAA